MRRLQILLNGVEDQEVLRRRRRTHSRRKRKEMPSSTPGEKEKEDEKLASMGLEPGPCLGSPVTSNTHSLQSLSISPISLISKGKSPSLKAAVSARLLQWENCIDKIVQKKSSSEEGVLDNDERLGNAHKHKQIVLFTDDASDMNERRGPGGHGVWHKITSEIRRLHPSSNDPRGLALLQAASPQKKKRHSSNGVTHEACLSDDDDNENDSSSLETLFLTDKIIDDDPTAEKINTMKMNKKMSQSCLRGV